MTILGQEDNWPSVIRVFHSIALAMFFAVCVTSCGGGGNGEEMYSFTLIEGSRVSTVNKGRPTETRAVSGGFEGIVRERGPDHIVLEIRDLSFRSIDDDRYSGEILEPAVLRVNRIDHPSGDLKLLLTVHDVPREISFTGSMSGQRKPALLDARPPGYLGAFRGETERGPGVGKAKYTFTLIATANGRPFPTVAPVEQSAAKHVRKPGM